MEAQLSHARQLSIWSSEPVIAHIDLDAFFASVEQLCDPRLRGKPVIVGNGVIASCSYEARRHGCHAGQSLSEAKRRCPQVAILDECEDVYRAFAEQTFGCAVDSGEPGGVCVAAALHRSASRRRAVRGAGAGPLQCAHRG